jgi:hypothetical protein
MTVEALIGRFQESREEVRKATEESVKATQTLQEKNQVIVGVQAEVQAEIVSKGKALSAVVIELSLKTNMHKALEQTETLQKTELSALEKKRVSDNQSFETCSKTSQDLRENLRILQEEKKTQDNKMTEEQKAKLQKDKDDVLKSWARFLWAAPLDQLEVAKKQLESGIKAENDAESILKQTKDAIAAKNIELEKTVGTLKAINIEIKDFLEKDATLKQEITLLTDCLNNVKKEEVVSNSAPIVPVVEVAKPMDEKSAAETLAVLKEELTVIHGPQSDSSSSSSSDSPVLATSFEQMQRDEQPLSSQVEALTESNAVTVTGAACKI